MQPSRTMGLNSITQFISQFFAQKNKELHNELPPHLADRSLRTIATRKQQETDALRLNLEKSTPRYKQVEQAGNFYRKALYSKQLQPTPIVKETLAQIEEILDRIDPVDQNQIDTVVRMPRVKPIKQSEPVEAQHTPKDGIPVIMDAIFKEEPVETMFLESVRKCWFLHQIIPSCLCVSPLQALNYSSSTYTYGEVSPPKTILVVPTRGLDEHIVRCFANPIERNK